MSVPYPTYDDEKDAAYREDPCYHDEPIDTFCRRCSDPWPEDSLVDGLCPDCMKSAGLVQCIQCGRAFVKEIAKVDDSGALIAYYCPFCKK